MQRMVSIEVMRLIAMFLIVIGHSVYNGVSNTPMEVVFPGGGGNFFIKSLLLLSHTAVNLYVMITGYFLIEKTDFRWKGFANVWLITLFYCIFFLLAFAIFQPSVLSVPVIVKSLLPVTTNQYWFITTYMALLLLAPYISRLVSGFNKRQYTTFVAIMLILSFEYPFGRLFAGNGFTLFWFVFLYLFAGYIRLYSLPDWIIKYRYELLLLCICFLMVPILITDAGILNLRRFSHLLDNGYNGFVSFLSFIIFICFVNSNMKGVIWEKIAAVAVYTFGVYVIHENILFRSFLWDSLKSITSSVYGYLLHASLFFVVALFVDYIRRKLFEIMSIDAMTNKLYTIISSKISKSV